MPVTENVLDFFFHIAHAITCLNGNKKKKKKKDSCLLDDAGKIRNISEVSEKLKAFFLES